MSPLRLLAVNVEPALVAELAGRGFAVDTVANATAIQPQYDVALTTHWDTAQSAPLTALKTQQPHLPVVLLASSATAGLAALQHGVERYLILPVNLEELEWQLRAAGEHHRRYATEHRRREVAEVLSRLPQIINQTLDIEQVMDAILEQLPRLIAHDSASIQLVRPALTGRDTVLEIRADRGLSDHPNALGGVTFALDPARHPNALVWLNQKPRIEADAPAHYEAFTRPEYHAHHIHSWLGVPLTYRQRALGVLSIDKREPNYYTAADLELVLTFANQAAIAIANAQLYAAAEQRATTLETLLDVGQTLATRTIEDPGLVLQTIVEGAKRVTGADCVVIYPYDKERQSYDAQLVRAVGLRSALAPRDTPRSATGLSTSIVKKGRLTIDDLDNDEGLREAKFNQREGIKAFAAVSLAAGDEPVGLLFVNYRARHRFTTDDEKLIDLFANQAAIAIANSRLHHKVYANLSRHINELEEKYKLTSLIIAIQDNLDLEAVLLNVLRRALSLTHAQGGWIALVNDAQTDYQVRAAHEHRVPDAPPWLPLAGTLLEQALQRAAPLRVDDLAEPTWATARAPERVEGSPPFDTLRVRAVLIVPLIETRTSIGAICITSDQPQAFTPQDAQDLQRLSPDIVLAVRNARAYDQAQRDIQNLDRLLQVGPLVFHPLRLTDTLNAIIEQARQTLPEVDILTLYYKDEAQHTIRLAGTYGVRATTLADTRERADNVVSRLMADKATIIAPDTAQEARLAGRFVTQEQVASTIAVPLIAGAETVGAMFVNYRKRHAFQEKEVHLVNLFATYAAAAIDKAWQYEALVRQERHLAALREASAAMAFSLNVDDILTRILTQAQALTAAWFCSYQRLEGDALVFVQAAPPEALADLQHAPGRIPIQQGITGQAVRERKAIYIADVTQVPHYITPPGFTPYAELAIPLMDGVECLGVLNLELAEPGLDEETQALMVTLANDAAIAVKNARLYEQTQRRAKIFEQLRTLSLQITSNLDLTHVLESVVRGAVSVLQADIATVFIIERAPTEGPLAEITAATQYTGLMCEHGQVRRADGALSPKVNGLAARVFKTREPVVINDIQSEPLLQTSRLVREKGICASVCAPLRSGDADVLGVLYVDHCRPYRFSDDDVQTIELFAAQAALAVQNAQRYRALENARDRALATEAVAWMGLIGSEWTHAINQKTFGFGTYLKGLELLARRLDAEAAEQLRAGIAGIQATVEHIRLVPLTRAEGMHTVTQPTLVDEALVQLVSEWGRVHPGGRLEFRLHCPGVRAHIELQWFKVALEKLVNNALRVLNGKGQLTVSSERIGAHIQVTIHDTGPGLPDYAREHFLKQRIAKPREAEQTGTGAGVLIARFILLSHNGSLELNYSDAKRGTELVMMVPIFQEQALARDSA